MTRFEAQTRILPQMGPRPKQNKHSSPDKIRRLQLVNCVTKDIEFILKPMHAMSSIQTPIKLFTLEKGMKMSMSSILMNCA